MISKGDVEFGLLLTGIGAAVVGAAFAFIYGVITVAKWAWSG